MEDTLMTAPDALADSDNESDATSAHLKEMIMHAVADCRDPALLDLLLKLLIYDAKTSTVIQK